MVSYAQNGEDIMLARALRDVQHGFYVDVGAAGPTEHSVTRTFYDRGWTGINVEPTQHFFEALAAARPHDVNLQVALDEAAGERTFFAFEGTGLSTLDAEVAENHKPGGWPMSRTAVHTRTLADVCAEFAPPTVHFLKIDVEGAEAQVLRGADFARFRPWIVVVEATRPMSPEPDYAGWEPLLTGAGYEFAWFDGLNRFYLATEQADRLRGFFRVPVNYFDDFDLHNPLAERFGAEADAARRETTLQRKRGDEAEAELARARKAAGVAETSSRLAQEASDLLRQRVADLESNIADLQHTLGARDAVLEQQRAEYEARLAVQHEHTHHRRLAQEHAEARVAELEDQLRFLQRLATPADALDGAAPLPRPTGARGLLVGLYAALLRPVLRPALWRTRTFLLNSLRREQLVLHEERRQELRDVSTQLGELRHRLDTVSASLHTALDRPVPVVVTPTAPSTADADLTGLVRSLESALMVLAVTAERAGGR